MKDRDEGARQRANDEMNDRLRRAARRSTTGPDAKRVAERLWGSRMAEVPADEESVLVSREELDELRLDRRERDRLLKQIDDEGAA
jgi:hypothetical protein